jgi:AcrR family transcriptional regulator
MARTRSEQLHRKVLEAALNLFAERGIESTSMDAIAEASGVSKATIYQHWEDKDALCLETLCCLSGHQGELPVFDSGDLRADLIAQLSYEPAAERKQMRERLMPHIIAYSTRNKAFGERWKASALEWPRIQLKRILRRACAEGRLNPALNLDVAYALLLGPLLYRNIFTNQFTAKLPENFIEQIVDTVCRAYAAEPAARRVLRSRGPRPA